MPLNQISLWRNTLRPQSRFGTPYEQYQIPQPEEPNILQRMWRGITPWKEERGETLGTAWQQFMETPLPGFQKRTWGKALGELGEVALGASIALPAAGVGFKALGAVARGTTGARAVGARVGQAVLAPIAGAEKVVGAGVGLLGKGLAKVVKPLKLPGIPDVLSNVQKVTVAKLVTLIEKAKPLRRETERLYTKERMKRIARYEQALERGEGEAAFIRAKGALRGELPRAKISTAFEEVRGGITQGEVDTLFGVIKNTKYPDAYGRLNTSTGLEKLLLGAIPAEAELKLLETTFGRSLVKAILRKRGLGTRMFEAAIDAANIPRSLLASMDISALLRQGFFFVTRYPREAIQTVKPMIKAFFSDKYAAKMDSIIRSRPHFKILEKHGAYIAPLPGKEFVSLTRMEEAFMSKWANKLPFVKASNRAYVTGLNDMRTRWGGNIIEAARRANIPLKEMDYREITKLVNWATGRGTLPTSLNRAGHFLNTLLFSPRLILSRLQLPLMAASPSKVARVEAWKAMGSFLGTVASVLGAAKLTGVADVGLDPRSADFGKLKIGETRLDIWAGYVQYMRFMARLVTGETRTAAGYLREVPRSSVIGSFVQSKLAPGVGLVNDILKGQTYMGEEMVLEGGFIGEQVFQRMMPLAIQDMVDAWSVDGPVGGLVASPAFFGVGVVTYTEPTTPQQLARVAFQEIEGKIWARYPEDLRRTADDIAKLERGDDAEQAKARRLLQQYPQIMMARRMIALEKKRWKAMNQPTAGRGLGAPSRLRGGLLG